MGVVLKVSSASVIPACHGPFNRGLVLSRSDLLQRHWNFRQTEGRMELTSIIASSYYQPSTVSARKVISKGEVPGPMGRECTAGGIKLGGLEGGGSSRSR